LKKEYSDLCELRASAVNVSLLSLMQMDFHLSCCGT
jgi:hypothetical protein